MSIFGRPFFRAFVIGLLLLGDGTHDGGTFGALVIATAIIWFVIFTVELGIDIHGWFAR